MAAQTDMGTTAWRRYKNLRNGRGQWDSYWRESALYVYPEANDFWQSWQNSAHGEKKNQRIYDATAMMANGNFASLLESMLVPRHSLWHNLTVDDPIVMRDRASREWLEQSSETLFRKRYAPSANFQMQIGESFMSIGAFGNGIIFTDDVLGNGLRYKSKFIGDVYFDVDPAGIVDTVYCRFDYSNKQAVQRWGDQAPKDVIKAAKDAPYDRKEYVHCVVPNPNPDPERMDAAGMPLMSLIIYGETQETVEIGGYNTMPYSIGRYQTSPHELYGRGPAMKVLPDIRTLNEMARADLRATHKLVDPPLLVHDDGLVGAGRSDIFLDPGAINFGGVSADGRPLIQPLQTNARVDLNEAKMDVKRQTIKEAFLVNLFEILENKPRMTATEVLARAQEKSALIGPIMGRIQSEMLGPIIQREMEILFDMGALAPPPAMILDAMQQDDLQINYESPLSRLQRAEQLSGIDMVIQQAVQLANIGKQDAINAINGAEVMRRTVDGSGAPVEILHTPEEIAAQAAAQEQELQQAQQSENAAAQAGAVKDLAQAEALQAGI